MAHAEVGLATIALFVGCLCWAARAEVGECNSDTLSGPAGVTEEDDGFSLLQTAHEPQYLEHKVQDQARALESHADAAKDHGEKSVRSPAVNEYAWSSRGKNPQTNTYSKDTAPADFSQTSGIVLWNNSKDEEIRHTPLIDHESKIYIASTTYIRKFDSDGKMLWDYFVPEEDGSMTTSPALYDGFLFAMSTVEQPPKMVAFSINMETGLQAWKQQYDGMRKSGDSQAILAFNNTVLVPSYNDPTSHMGSDSLLALRTSDGSKLWEYITGDVMWNFKPSTPGDGSIMFSSSCGAVHRIDFDGNVIWKRDAVSLALIQGFCSMGGGAVGPNGVFYAEHGDRVITPNGLQDVAHINAYNIEDGEHLWSQTFNEFGGQYPAVGYLGQRLAVVAPIGTMFSGARKDGGPLGSDKSKWLVNAVVAMDAQTGAVLWRHEEEPWPFRSAAGDFGSDMARRKADKELDPRRETGCLPDPQGIPLISGDGHVYVSNSQNGDLSAIKDENGDGIISSAEVSTFPTNIGFLNSPSVAPGMLVAAPCWGPVYVFKE